MARVMRLRSDHSVLQRQERNQATLMPTRHEASQGTVDSLVGAEGLLPTPARTLPPPCLWGVLRAANPADLGHGRM